VNLHWLSLLMLFAQAGEAEKPPAATQGPDSYFPLLLLGLLVFLFYFIVMRPQRKEQSKRQEMLSNVKKNDRVVTIGGIYGVVMNVHREADEVSLKVDEATNTKLRITLSSIARVLGDEPSEDEKSK
jgi:preprotein translocase subunit YajC